MQKGRVVQPENFPRDSREVFYLYLYTSNLLTILRETLILYRPKKLLEIEGRTLRVKRTPVTIDRTSKRVNKLL